MRREHQKIVFAPTDLARFMENPYTSWMDRLHLEQPDIVTPDPDTGEQEIIADLGMAHEKKYLRKLQEDGRDVLALTTGSHRDRLPETLSAMEAGQEIIYQGALAHVGFAGFADFLVRVEEPSKLGNYGYEVWDTKLAKTAKPYSIIQLCCYADILEQLQGVRPQRLVIISGENKRIDARTDAYFYYYLEVKQAFLEQQASFDRNHRPEPLAEGKNGRWETEAEKWLREVDHLSQVAGIRRDQIKKLSKAGIDTMRALALAPVATDVRRMREETFEKLRLQANLQLRSANLPAPLYDIVSPRADDARRGLALLPPASELDVAFDIEGFPHAEDGLEYLLGATTKVNGELRFDDWWAHNDKEEKQSFEAFIDWVMERWQRDPSMHVFHYASYEVTAMRRLMGKYGTREREVDDLLRNEVFVDLYTLVRQGLRIGAPSYSLKKVEALYLEKRQEAVATAGDSIVFYQKWRDNPDGSTWQDSEILRSIRDYNKVDCDSTWMLIDWLRDVQRKSGVQYLPRPDKSAEEKKNKDEESEAALLASKLLDAIPEDRAADPEKWRVHELLAHLVEFHWREEKPTWWRMFDRRDMTESALRDDLDCLAGLTRTDTPPQKIKRSTGFAFHYDVDQDTKLRAGGKKPTQCYFAHDLTPCSIFSMDSATGKIVLKLGPTALEQLGDAGVPNRLSLIPDEYVSGSTIAASIVRVVKEYAETGQLPSALEDLLYRRRPRVSSRPTGPLCVEGEASTDTALAVVPDMDQTTLCIQGPPGTGKTYTGAHAILKLLAAGKRVGVTTNSHKAIVNLLQAVSEAAEKKGLALNAVKFGGDQEEPLLKRPGFSWVASGRDFSPSDDGSTPSLLGGTAWVFSHPSLANQLDYLFVDEAGQVALANLVGMLPSTKNIVLLGDQMQLSQPLQGSHPGESGQSCLDYLLQEHATIPDDLGIFLSTSYRMHPDICQFISGVVYEDRLTSVDYTANRRILPADGGLIDRGTGLLFVPVEHEANRQGSLEEVGVVKTLVEELLRAHHTDKDGGDAGPLGKEDILIIAPYNLQVRLLKQALGDDCRVGTIDKFQGQQAPVVIVSMAASSAEESPRGIDFLFDPNRLNVAVSRAQSLAILVSHPTLARTSCSTLDQMARVNIFARATQTGSRLPIRTRTMP